MNFDKDKIKKELKLFPFGQKGWFSNKEFSCPSCRKRGKIGILFVKNSGIVHCFKCDYKTSLYNFLKEIDRKDLINNEYEVSLKNELLPLFEETEEKSNDLKSVKLPIGSIRVDYDDYLEKRGFLKKHYELFEPFITKSFLEKNLNNNICFKIKQKGKIVAWLSRSKKTKEFHKLNLERSKVGEENLILRYINSEGVDFSKILGGYDELTDNTKTVIIVEGLFDKTNTDINLNLLETEEIKCCFTFGNSMSIEQINLLREFKNLKTIILLYDPGTIKQSKQLSMILSRYFLTYVCLIDNCELDPGNMNFNQLESVLMKKELSINFYINNFNSNLV